MTDPESAAKRVAAEAAAQQVQSGMCLGLGTGSTAWWFIEAIGAQVAAGLEVTAVASSRASAEQAQRLGIALVDLDTRRIDLAVDGADQVDAQLRVIKGGGGAHVRERLLAVAAQRFVVIIDPAKLVEQLVRTVPLEILEFGSERTLAGCADLGGGPATWRMTATGEPLRSDNGNLLADLDAGVIHDAEGLAAGLDALAGVVGHGLFLGITDEVLVGNADGSVQQVLPQR